MVNSIPLYRFLDSNGALKTLEAGKFRVGLISRFNDLFEWKLGFTGMTNPKEQQLLETLPVAHVRWLDSWMGVLCFSDSFSPPVLWSMYGDKHRGVAFEVIYPWPVDVLQKMTYFPSRPIVDLNQLRAIGRDQTKLDQFFRPLLMGLMTNKSPGFSFEQEYRLQIELKRCRCSDANYEWQLPDKALARVILGYCCPLDETLVRKLLDMNGFLDTNVVRAKMCHESYSIIV
jgi:hypothetical protein